jgi:hypothetical protein
MRSRGNARDGSFVNLLFFSACGVRFAVDADQVAGTAAFEEESEEGPPRLFTVMGCGDQSVDKRGATMLTIKSNNLEPFRLVVDVLEDMAGISVGDIRSLPPLIEPFALQRGMWGVIVRDGKLVLLMDFQRLMKNKGPERVRDGGD